MGQAIETGLNFIEKPLLHDGQPDPIDQDRAILDDLLLGKSVDACEIAHNQAGGTRRRVRTFSIAVALVAAALVCVYFRGEDVTRVTQYANLHDVYGRTIGERIVEPVTDWFRRSSLALRDWAEADKGGDLVRQSSEMLGSISSNTAQDRQALDVEHARSDALAKELVKVRREFDAAVTLASKAGDDLAQFRQTTKDATVRLEQSLQQERDRSAALSGQLPTARQDFETKMASASDAAAQLREVDEAKIAQLAQRNQEANAAIAELERSLQQERNRGAALASELTAARREFEMRMALASKARDEATQLREAAEAQAAELQQSLQRERDNALTLMRDLISALQKVDARTPSDRTANNQIDQTNQAAAPAAAKPAPVGTNGSSQTVVRLMGRASTLLAQGNVSAARIVLERAVEKGSPSASFALAETYDPHVLSRWGTRGDASKARDLYTRARDGGIQEAKDRLKALNQ
jgi:flagellar biosynthesis GTPase FlhF